MGDSNTPINQGVSVHHHANVSSQGGALKSNLTVIETPDGSGQYVVLEALY